MPMTDADGVDQTKRGNTARPLIDLEQACAHAVFHTHLSHQEWVHQGKLS